MSLVCDPVAVAPKFQMFQMVEVDGHPWVEGVKCGWIVGIEYLDPLGDAEAIRQSQEPLFIRDVEESPSEGEWYYKVSFQWGLDRQRFGDMKLLDVIDAHESCLKAMQPAMQAIEYIGIEQQKFLSELSQALGFDLSEPTKSVAQVINEAFEACQA